MGLANRAEWKGTGAALAAAALLVWWRKNKPRPVITMGGIAFCDRGLRDFQSFEKRTRDARPRPDPSWCRRPSIYIAQTVSVRDRGASFAGWNDLLQILVVGDINDSGAGLRTNRFAESILRLQSMLRCRDRARGTQVPLVRPDPSGGHVPHPIPPDLLEELQDMFDLLDDRS